MVDKHFIFEKLLVYNKAKDYVLFVYGLLKLFPLEERYAICDQLRRASVSIVSNIAEGTCRTSEKEKCHYLDIAYGSLMETYSQLDIAATLHYILDAHLEEAKTRATEILRLLAGLKKSYSVCEHNCQN